MASSNLVSHRATVSEAGVYVNPTTHNKSIMLRLNVGALEDPAVVGFLPLTSTVIGAGTKSRYAGQTTEARTRALIASACPAAVRQDGKLDLDLLEGADVLATFAPDGDLVSISGRGPRII